LTERKQSPHLFARCCRARYCAIPEPNCPIARLLDVTSGKKPAGRTAGAPACRACGRWGAAAGDPISQNWCGSTICRPHRGRSAANAQVRNTGRRCRSRIWWQPPALVALRCCIPVASALGCWAIRHLSFAQPSEGGRLIRAASSLGRTPRGGRLEENAQGDGRYCTGNFCANLDCGPGLPFHGTARPRPAVGYERGAAGLAMR
jgi:hypothetical protein